MGFCFTQAFPGTQGDTIGRNFAHWANVFYGQVIENYIFSPNLWATIFHDKIYLLVFNKKRVGLHLGRFVHKLIRRQSYDRDLQRQRCKNLQRQRCKNL
jgi:hypothetical protein